jgi:cell division protein FtsI/penicillin-binding protein 2
LFNNIRRNRYFTFRKKIYDKRIKALGVILFLIFLILICRYNYWFIIKGNTLKTMADAQYFFEQKINDKNYTIFDCNGKEMLEHEMEYYTVIDPVAFVMLNTDKNREEIKEAKYILRNYNENYDLDKVKTSDGKIVYNIDQESYNKLQNIRELNNISGLYIYKYSCVKKGYAWNIVNMLASERDSKDGRLKSENSLEIEINKNTEKNEYSRIKFEKDGSGKIINREEIHPQNNVNVRLTLDKNIQKKIKKILLEPKYSSYGQIGVVLMETDSGKLKALVQKDDSLPNVNIGVATNHGAFPGSIFKVIVEEAGLDKNILDLNKKYKHLKKSEEGKQKLEFIDIGEALARSCNDVFYEIGVQVGYDYMYDYAEAQGLLNPVLGMHNEQRGNFEVDEDNITIDQVRHTAIGQKIRITPLGALSIPNSVINNGIYVKPNIIDAYVDDDNNVLEEFKINMERRRVMDKSTAETLKNHMIKAVNEGSGTQAKIEHIKIGGKTGTTEYFEINNDNIREKYSDGWFVGFFQLDKKYYSMVVLVKKISIDGENIEGGGNTAAPIFKEIVEMLNDKKYLSQ